VLLLDEATSALDAESEHLVQVTWVWTSNSLCLVAFMHRSMPRLRYI
jgi:ABC-type multidrug transport system fused ATPase/permease subunit